ncbi:hypothetical protein ACEPAF_587 [Sanghuangporus sanghuang]
MALDKPPDLKVPTCLPDVLASAGELLYLNWGSRVVRLQEGVVLKCSPGVTDDEVAAMRYARDKVHLPVPKVLCVPPRPKIADATAMASGAWCICMQECPGQPLDKVINDMTKDELAQVANQLSDIIHRMSEVHSSRLGNVHGGPYNNMFFPPEWSLEESFESVDKFIDAYRQLFLLLDCSKTFTENLLSQLPRDASITFTHGDLLPKNIMVDGTTITGIIDWETGGFYPSYWEYCRMYDPHFLTPAWEHILSCIFPEERRQNEIDAVRGIMNILAHCF